MPNWYSYFSEGLSVNIVNEAGKQQSAFNSLPGAGGSESLGLGAQKIIWIQTVRKWIGSFLASELLSMTFS